jgi:hypothetical protein
MGFMRGWREEYGGWSEFRWSLSWPNRIIAAIPRNTYRSGAVKAEYYKFDALSLRQPKSFVN